ncbi:uncharacterized protein [Cherax quadricarinatus]|uniref:uncharacterized protein n=1 Tax=Cherax quadricarinatus TaxID=27406 RepID=UPI00387EDA7B
MLLVVVACLAATALAAPHHHHHHHDDNEPVVVILRDAPQDNIEIDLRYLTEVDNSIAEASDNPRSQGVYRLRFPDGYVADIAEVLHVSNEGVLKTQAAQAHAPPSRVKRGSRDEEEEEEVEVEEEKESHAPKYRKKKGENFMTKFIRMMAQAREFVYHGTLPE